MSLARMDNENLALESKLITPGVYIQFRPRKNNPCDELCEFFHPVNMWSCRQALFLHRQALSEQLKETEDPALVLHLTSVLLFQASTQCMLHAPGRCVPQIIGTLTGRIPTVSAALPKSYQPRLSNRRFKI